MVRANRIGVNGLDPAFDVARRAEEVCVFDNETDFAGEQLRLPDQQALVAGAR